MEQLHHHNTQSKHACQSNRLDRPCNNAGYIDRREVPRYHTLALRDRTNRTSAAYKASKEGLDKEDAIGHRVCVQFDDNKWYSGCVKEFSRSMGEHLIVYDDGDARWHTLSSEQRSGTLKFGDDARPVDAKAAPPPSMTRPKAGRGVRGEAKAGVRPSKLARRGARIELDLTSADGESVAVVDGRRDRACAAATQVLAFRLFAT